MWAREFRRFALHYVEMVVAMLLGMMALWPLWMLATSGVDDGSVLRGVEVESLVMATTMAVPMAAWMRFRGHRWAPTLEMSLAMYGGFLVTFPFLWAGALDADGVMMIGHTAMFTLMLVAMLFRWNEYARHHHGAHGEEDAEATLTAS